MNVFAITGGIASGKSRVTQTFADEGVGIVDADLIARRIVEPGSSLLEELWEAFGSEILREGALDRKKLGNTVFGSPEKLAQLNGIMVPAIIQRIDREVAERSKTHKLVCVDAPTLIENGLQTRFKPVVLVVSSYQDQLDRVMKRGFTEMEARARIDAQLPTEEKLKHADYVIYNESSMETLRAMSLATLKKIREAIG